MSAERIAVLLVCSLPAVTGCSGPARTVRPAVKSTKAPTEPLPETLGAMRHSIETDVTAGFSTPNQIVETAVEVFSDEQPPAVLRQAARRLLDEALAKHAADQRGWPAVTDCDRLDRAFADLERRGIFARQNFSDCGTCGVAEIADEIDAARQDGRPVRGYVFYHAQDTESAAEGHGLYLNYGSVEDDEKAALTVATEVIEAFKRHGLNPNWDGTLQQRIGVKMDWKRRR
jgi:hypothetical protein